MSVFDRACDYAKELGVEVPDLPNLCHNEECECDAIMRDLVIEAAKTHHKLTATTTPGGWYATDDNYEWTPDGGHGSFLGHGDTEADAIADYVFQLEESRMPSTRRAAPAPVCIDRVASPTCCWW
jgi:hypothetical protein